MLWCLSEVSKAQITIAAWGCHRSINGRSEEVKRIVRGRNQFIHVLGLTKGGCPRHPLYLKKTTKPFIWREWMRGEKS